MIYESNWETVGQSDNLLTDILRSYEEWNFFLSFFNDEKRATDFIKNTLIRWLKETPALVSHNSSLRNLSIKLNAHLDIHKNSRGVNLQYLPIGPKSRKRTRFSSHAKTQEETHMNVISRDILEECLFAPFFIQFRYKTSCSSSSTLEPVPFVLEELFDLDQANILELFILLLEKQSLSFNDYFIDMIEFRLLVPIKSEFIKGVFCEYSTKGLRGAYDFYYLKLKKLEKLVSNQLNEGCEKDMNTKKFAVHYLKLLLRAEDSNEINRKNIPKHFRKRFNVSYERFLNHFGGYKSDINLYLIDEELKVY